MKNVQIGPKLIGSYLLIVLLAIFVSVYLLIQLSDENDSTDELYGDGVMSLNNMIASVRSVNFMRITAYQAGLAETKEERYEKKKEADEFAEAIRAIYREESLKKLDANEIRLIGNILSCLDDYMKLYGAFIDTLNEGHSGRYMLQGTMGAKAAELVKNNREYIVQREDNARELNDYATQVYKNSTRNSIMLLAAIIIVALAIGIYMTFSIKNPLSKIVDTLKEAGTGDMRARANLNRKDELGFVGGNVDKFFAEMQEVIKSIHSNSNTLVSASEELSAVSRQMASGAEETVNQSTMVASTAEQMSVNINAMASGAEQASANATEVAGAAEQMSTNMNTIASAVEEMSASISEIAHNTSEVREIATEANSEATEATNAMNKLGIAAKEIGQVTDVIKKIADKTNLLALNATIEAASAGEAGKGFAVVAGEIKELANQSAKSADDIAKRIDSIQNGTNDAVTVIGKVSCIIGKINSSVESIAGHVEQQTKASNEIASNVSQANTGAKRVASAVSEVAKGANDVSRNATEAAKGANDVSTNSHSMNNVAKESAQGASQVNQSAGDLSKVASELKQTVNKFTI
jgi:methyl-accepting chemotaxis protein